MLIDNSKREDFTAGQKREVTTAIRLPLGFCHEYDEAANHALVDAAGRRGAWARYEDPAASLNGMFVCYTDYWLGYFPEDELIKVRVITGLPEDIETAMLAWIASRSNQTSKAFKSAILNSTQPYDPTVSAEVINALAVWATKQHPVDDELFEVLRVFLHMPPNGAEVPLVEHPTR